MPKLSDRVNTFTDSVIRRMTRISDEYGAINLSHGFPDFAPPKAIIVCNPSNLFSHYIQRKERIS